MCKKRFLTYGIISGLTLMMCLTSSCGKKESTGKKEKDTAGTVHVLNEFEKNQDLYSLKPSVANTIASMQVVNKENGQVKEGEGSLQYQFESGLSPDMMLFIKESDCPKVDISNLNKVSVSVYSEQETEATLSLVTTGKAILMSETFDLKANEWNELDFRLSALACKYNAEQIVGFSLRIESAEAATYYIDHWNVTMGAENTEEDNKWEPVMKDIIERIEKLPKEISLSDGDGLETLYLDYAELPELYRNIIPNYEDLKAAIEQYVDVKFASEEDGLERKFFAFDEFYGIGQIENGMNGHYPILYQREVKYGDENGSTMITFDGSTQESYFAYTSPLDPSRYDYVEMSFYNADVWRKVIYFNWNQFIIVEPDTWGTIKVSGDEFRATGNIIVDTINEYGTRINSSGVVYMSAMKAYRRDLLSELKKLPSASNFEIPRDIKYLTLVEQTMELYLKLPETEKANISKDLIANLEACYKKIDGYSTVFDVNTEDVQFGTPDCKAQGEGKFVEDKTYGPAWELNFTGKAAGDYAAGFQFNKDMNESKNLFFYIYNPKTTSQTMYLYADGSWKDCGSRTLEPGWNKIEVPSEIVVHQFLFGLFPKNADVTGAWKVTSVYSVENKIIDRDEAATVVAMIQALPNASDIQMPRDLKYVAAIGEASDAYEALSANAKNSVSSALKNKLQACLKAIEGYRAVINARTDEMMVGTYDCACVGSVKRIGDNEFGTVFALDIMKADTKGDYAGGFQINKDLSGDKNIYFNIYNPKKSAQLMYLYADGSWTDLGAVSLNPGWNKIEISNDIRIKMYVFGLFPKGAEITDEWKISSFYSLSDTIIDKRQAASTIELIENLPKAASIQMPDDLKYVTAIDAASRSYEALSAAAKKQVSAKLQQKLQDCLKAIEGYKAVVNAAADDITVGTPDCACAGILGRSDDKNYGTVYDLKITGNATTGDYAAGFQFNQRLAEESNLFFYVYNPKDSAQTMYLYADPAWKDLGTRTLNPGWNRIDLSNDVKVEHYFFGLFPKGTDAVGTWKISSVFAVSNAILDKEEAASAIAEITLLPNATSIQMPEDLKYVTDVYAANAAYQALSDAAKKYVSAELKQKLTDCMSAVSGYEVVVNAKTDDMSVGTPDCICKGILKRKNQSSYGAVFALNIMEEAAGDYAAGFQVTKDLAGKKNIFFYIYNPMETSQIMYLYANGSWTDLGARTLTPGWNKIEIPNGTDIKYVFGLFPRGQQVVGEWLITSLFTVSDEVLSQEKVQNVETMIAALPSVDALEEADREAVMNAKNAYDALSESEKANVSNAPKLQECLAKLEELGLKQEISYIAEGNYRAEYYDNTANDYIAKPTVTENVVAGRKANWSATMTVVSADGTGYIRLYQKLDLTNAKLQSYKAKGYTHLRIPYYITLPEGASGEIHVHADQWVWNYKKSADIVVGKWTYFDYPIDDLLIVPDSTAGTTVLDGIQTLSGAFGLMNLRVNVTGEYGIYLGQAKMVNPETEVDQYAATEVEDMIKALPEADKLTVNDIEKVKTAKAAYDALNEPTKELVISKKKLNDCVAKLPELKTTVGYKSSPAPHFDYYSDATNNAYAGATIKDVTHEGKVAKWYATVNIAQQNGGYLRAYQGLDLTVAQLKEYQKQGYTHLRIPYYLIVPEASGKTEIHIHSNEWEWNYKKGADATTGQWTYFDYPLNDLLLEPATGKNVLDGINSVSGAYGLINILVKATGTYTLYLGECELIKPETSADIEVAYTTTPASRFDYFSDATNAAYANGTLQDVIYEGKTAKWSATVNITQQNGGYLRAYQGLDLTVEQVKEYQKQGYTHLRIPYYLIVPEASGKTEIHIHSNEWEWNYKKGADATIGQWTYFDYPLNDLLLEPSEGKVVLNGINSAYGNYGAYGLINILVKATGTYTMYLGQATLISNSK